MISVVQVHELQMRPVEKIPERAGQPGTWGGGADCSQDAAEMKDDQRADGYPACGRGQESKQRTDARSYHQNDEEELGRIPANFLEAHASHAGARAASPQTSAEP